LQKETEIQKAIIAVTGKYMYNTTTTSYENFLKTYFYMVETNY